VLSFEQIGRKIDELRALGGVQILIQGGHNPYIPFQWYLDLMRYIKRHHPIHIHGFSPSEIDFFAGRFGMTLEEVIRELVAAGLDAVPGGGRELLVPKIGQVALRFGANDFGSLMMEENVVSAAGTTWRMTLAEMQRLIADGGYVPRQRRQDYSVIDEAA